MMRREGDIERFVKSPTGAYFSGNAFLCGCAKTDVYFSFLWGRPDANDIDEFTRAIAAELRKGAERHLSFFDFSALDAIAPDAFSQMRHFWQRIAKRKEELVIKQALVRPRDLAGTVVAGFFHVYEPPYEARIFETAEEACRWLGVPLSLLASWQELRRQSQEAVPELTAVRQQLAQDPMINIEAMARELALSKRSLQRRLQETGNSFQSLQDRARLAAAGALLSNTSEKLTAIAARLGFSSPQHFSDWFRKHTGVAPSTYRLQRHGSGNV